MVSPVRAPDDEQYSAAVRRLRQIADPVFLCDQGTSGWLQSATSMALADPGILAAVGPNKISCLDSDGLRRPATIDAASLIASAVAMKSAREGRVLALSVAPGSHHMPLFLAAAMILGDTVRDAFLERSASAGILIISPDLSLRAKYSSLQIGLANIDAVHPGFRLTSNGNVELINSRKRSDAEVRNANSGLCFMYPTRNLPATVDLASCYVILDVRYGKESKRVRDLVKWTEDHFARSGVVILHTTGDTQTERELKRSVNLSFVLDHGAVLTCAQQLRLKSPDRQNQTEKALSVTFNDAVKCIDRVNEVRCIEHSGNVERLFASLFRTLFTENIYGDDPAMRRAAWLFSALRDLPIPLRFYESAAHAGGKYTLKRMIATLQQLVRQPKIGPVVQSLEVLLTELYKQLHDQSPRESTLMTAISKAIDEQDDSVVLLCKDATAVDAIELWMQEKFSSNPDALSRVEAVKYANAWTALEGGAGVCVLSGVLPVQHRWLYGADLGRLAVHLCAESQLPSLVTALRGPVDPARMARHSADRYKAMSTILGHNIAAEGKDVKPEPIRISGLKEISHRDLEAALQASSYLPDPAPTKKLRVIGKDMADLSAVLREFENQSVEVDTPATTHGDNVAPSDLYTEDEAETDISQDLHLARAIVGLRDGQHVRVYLEDSRHYEVLRRKDTGSLTYLSPPHLAPGDTLLLTDAIGRLSVFDQMLAIIAEGPAMKSLNGYRRAWNAAVRQLNAVGSSSGYLDCELLRNKLRRFGASIESDDTIRNWIDGTVMGPAKVSSIKAVGNLIGSRDMVDRSDEYDRAFRMIRSVHQTLGRHINAILRGAKGDFAVSDVADDYAKRDNFALPLRDLLQTIAPLEVLHVDDFTAQVSASKLHQTQPIS